MEIANSQSSSVSRYSPVVIVSLLVTATLAVALVMGWAYIYYRHGPSAILHFVKERRRTKDKDLDVEAVEFEPNLNRGQQEAALNQLQNLYSSNRLVGSTVTRPERVDIEQKPSVAHALPGHERRLQHSDKPRHSLDLAMDPMSYTLGSGKIMAQLYTR